jgi:hypothetical protein
MSKKKTTEEFIFQSQKINGDRYDYSSTTYLRAHEHVVITCKEHGSFSQRACDHLHQQQGCPKCAHNYPLDRDAFIQRSRAMYGMKFQVISEFKGVKYSITLSCENHGDFKIKVAQSHFQKDGGCPKCVLQKRLDNLKPGNTSKIETKWLDDLGVPLRQHRIDLIEGSVVVDGFDPNTNTVYECYGSYWHGNPELYSPEDINPTLGVSFGHLYQKTLRRETVLRAAGFNLVMRWVR